MRRTAFLVLPAALLLQAQAPAARPKLVVAIAVDQLSAELMQTYGPELTGGLARLMREGAYFTEAYHDHGFTETGPGHSVLLSGRFPAHTGIIENSWYDRGVGRVVYCVQDPASHALHLPAQASSSNVRFLGETLGDWLQAQVPGSRAFSVSGKDRAAILMAGRKPTAAYWFTGAAGFTSSSVYAERLPEWLARFDAGLNQRFLTPAAGCGRRIPERPKAAWPPGPSPARSSATAPYPG
jgi:hypothetical protein